MSDEHAGYRALAGRVLSVAATEARFVDNATPAEEIRSLTISTISARNFLCGERAVWPLLNLWCSWLDLDPGQIATRCRRLRQISERREAVVERQRQEVERQRQETERKLAARQECSEPTPCRRYFFGARSEKA